MRAALLLGLLALTWAESAQAATCVVNGSVQIESADGFYCRNGLGRDCSGWLEQDLETGTRPMKNMLLQWKYVWKGIQRSKYTQTDAAGNFTFQWPQDGSCWNSHELTVWFTRVHEADAAGLSTTRYPFQVTDHYGSPWGEQRQVQLSGSPTNMAPIVYARPNDEFLDHVRKIANVYYSTNSGLTEMRNWHWSIVAGTDTTSAQTILDVRYHPLLNSSCALGTGCVNLFPEQWWVGLNMDRYNRGSTVRHELGHVVTHLLQNKGPSGLCDDYRFGNVDGHEFRSCEWGSVAQNEGLAMFLSVRSIMNSNTNGNAWLCDCADNANQQVCSTTASGTLDNDRIMPCMGGTFAGVGDLYAFSNEHCTRVLATGCRTCNGSFCDACVADALGECVDWQTGFAYRNETNVMRFLWDVIDGGTDNGQDDTDETMQSLSALYSGMQCVAGSGYGVDGTCNEQRRASDSECVPSSDIGDAVLPMRGSRDSGNAWDLSELVPLDQTAERAVNCTELPTVPSQAD